MKKITFVVRRICLILSFLTLLGSCQIEQNSEIRFGLASMPSNLDPRFATDAASIRIGRLMYQQLVDFNQSKQVIPSIAHWQQLNATHYRFTLNNSRSLFHNGKSLTSEDVKATYDFILEEKNASPHRTILAVIKDIVIINDTTFDFILSHPDPLFPAYLVVGIVPKSHIEKHHPFNKYPMGSGPFQFISVKNSLDLSLQRRADNQVLRFIHVPNPVVRALKLMRGEIDMTQNDIMPELVNFLSEESDLSVEKSPGSNFSYLGFNFNDPILKIPQIRRSISYGIDRQAIIQYVLQNTARPAQSILPPEHWAGNKTLRSFQHNPAKAKKLLAEHGYSTEKPLQLSFKTSSDPFRIRIATVYQDQLAKIGIDLKISSYDWGTFYGDIKAGRFQLYSLAWVGINSPDIFRYTMHSDSIPPHGANRGKFIDKTVDELIEKAESLNDLTQQAQVYKKLQGVLLDKLPYVPLWYEDHVLIKRNYIKNYTLSSNGNYDGLINTSIQTL